MTAMERYGDSVAEFPREAARWLGTLPDDWEVTALKYAATLNDDTLPESTDPDYLMEYTDISAVSLEGGIEATEPLTFSNAPSRARRIAKDGDTLISTVRTYLRAITTVKEAPDNLIASTGFAVVRPRPRLHAGFLGYFATANAFVDAVVAQSTGVSYPATSPSALGRLPVAYPDLEKQRSIAQFLDRKTAEIDALIAKKAALLNLLAEKRAAIVTHAVTKGLDPDAPMKPSGIDWLGEIPAHWEVAPFKWRCTIQSGQVDPEAFEFADLPLIAPDHIESGTGRLLRVQSSEEQGAISGKYFFKSGSLLYSKIRPLLAKVCIFPERGLCSADMYAIDPGDKILLDFLFFLFLSRHFTSLAVMESLRVAMPKVNREALGDFPLLIPPRADQQLIVAHIKRESSLVDRMEITVKKAVLHLTEYRSALITAAVTGQIAVG